MRKLGSIMALALRGSRWLWRPGMLSAAAFSHRKSFSTEPSAKIYEMRRYKIKPDKYTEFIRLGTEKYEETIMPHGKLVGYWATSMGSLNEVYHLWEYDSYAHRDEVVKAKQSDKRAVEEYLKYALSYVESQNHVMMKPFAWYTPKLDPQKWGVYELVTQKVKPDMMEQLVHRVLQGLPARLAEDYPHALGFWYSVFGTADLFISLWPHESFDKRDDHRAQLLQHNEEWIETKREAANFITELDVQGLVPLPWSPLQ